MVGKDKKRIARLHDHRRGDHFSELDQIFDRAGFGDAAAGDDQRPLGLREQLGGFSQRFGIAADARRDARAFGVRILDADRFAEQIARQRQINRPGRRRRGDFEGAIQIFRDAVGAMNLGAPFGELLGHLDQIFALGVRVAADDARVDIGRRDDHRRAVAIGVIKCADRIGRARQGAYLGELRPAGDARVTVGHGDDAGLMHRQNEADFFLIGDGADEFLAAGAGQTENIFDAMGGGDFQIGLRGDFFCGHF